MSSSTPAQKSAARPSCTCSRSSAPCRRVGMAATVRSPCSPAAAAGRIAIRCGVRCGCDGVEGGQRGDDRRAKSRA
eukprot:4330812-Prymnesium_polylepis.1